MKIRCFLAVLFSASAITLLAQPANDNFVNAFTLTGANVSTNGTTALATKESGEPNHAGNTGGRSVWYRWTAPQSGLAVVNVTASYRDLLAVYTGTAVNALSPVASAASGFGTGNVGLSFTANAGTTYYIAIDVRNAGAGGAFSLAVQMPTILFPFGSTWKYLDDGTDQGTAWQTNTFNDGAWSSGPGQLGYGDGDESTVVSYGPDSANKYTTTYFRRSFSLGNAAAVTAMTARYQRDDGIVVYVNGLEAFRNNMPAGAVTYTTLANLAGDDGATVFSSSIPVNLLRTGNNVIAVEVHQEAGTSTDISFDMELSSIGGANSLPSVSITSPSTGTRFMPGTNITISASASDSDGTVTNVALYAGVTLLKNFTAPPYTVTWSNVPQGDYKLTAVATDNTGQSATSAGVDISVNTFFIVPVTLVPKNSTWKYLDNGTDQGTAWQSFGFNDSSWPSGPGQLGYGDGDEATVLGFGPDANNKYPTYYFRRLFTVTNAAAVSNLTINLMRDDGAVIYINGAEVRRDNMPAGVITFTTVALGAVANADESTYFGTTNSAVLNTGTNIIAVEVHQNNGTSTDVSFDLELIANLIQGAQITNTVPPYVQSQNPAGGSTVASLSSIQVNFSEAVSGVNASDLLINGTPATGVTGSGNIYTFTFTQPPLGQVNITWANGHGIVDQGTPQLAFDGAASSNVWSYMLLDNVAPTVAAKSPTAGSTLSNLTSINVTFSEAVLNVNASDLLINGAAAIGLAANSSSNYTFSFGQPPPGPVSVTWAGGHGIVDGSGNPFDANGVGATWSYFIENRVQLVATNAFYRWVPGTSEPSNPTDQWRLLGFNDSAWTAGQAPFYYDDDMTPVPYYGNTLITGMRNNYTTIYLRTAIAIPTPTGLTNFTCRWKVDDGYIVWINGTEAFRSPTVPAGTIPFNGTANNASEPLSFTTTPLSRNLFVTGTNIIAVQVINANAPSSDLMWDWELYADALDSSAFPPSIISVNPPAGDVFTLTNITVTFNEAVTNVNASDLRVNGVAATGMTTSNNSIYSFSFAQPAYGPVNVSWATGHGITDLDNPPKPFDGTAPGANFTYSLVNPSAPTVASQLPAAGTVTNLNSVTVNFSEAVMGVGADDLLMNGAQAINVTGGGATYTFEYAEPAYGLVTMSWRAGHNITDTEPAHNAFDATRPGNTWQYTYIDRLPPTVASKVPIAGANVTNITSLSVTFSENVSGINASDLLVNGIAATNVQGTGSNYTFTFTQPNQSVVNITWAIGHGIVDSAGNAFDENSIGGTWQYFTPDNVPPVVDFISPPPNATVRSLTQIAVTFSEPVAGVNASDLLVDNVPATQVSGSAAGPYTFIFAQPATGAVDVAWAPNHGIVDLASPPNSFVGDTWDYILDPNAVFAGKVVVNEIMFQPLGFSTNDEWIELRNVDTTPINLNGWRFTRGVAFTFPNVTIPANGYLVVAANVEAFQAKYPSVANVIGGWAGTLANNGESIRLVTALDETVDEVHYGSEGDWATRYHVIPVPSQENTQYGWLWRSDADGRGKSLELMNPAMPHDNGQNWRASTPTNGTPGAANSVATTNIAPMIRQVAHTPTVPRSTDTVTISAKIDDEQPGVTVRVFYRNVATLTPAAFTSVQMFDDGLHNDGAAGDRVFAATLPAQTNDAVIDFYVQAVDVGSRTSTWPAPVVSETNVVGQFANALYQVDDRAYPFPQPIYKFIMTEQERQQRDFIAQSRPQSDAEMNATFISIDGTGVDLRYNCGIRERGAGSRGYVPSNQRVNIPNDRVWHDQTEMNLNTRYTHPQFAGYLLSFLAGLDTEPGRVVRVRLNNRDQANAGSPQYGCYVHLQPPGAELMTLLHPTDDGGNVYRAGGARNATLAYLGTNPTSYQNVGYDKVSNSSENDWNDLFNLTFILNNTPNSNYTAAVRSIVNVEEWMTYFAVDALLWSRETTLATGAGDDYTLYFAPTEKRFYIVAHDWDTILNEGDTTSSPPSYSGAIFRADALPAINRFMHWPEFTQVYYDTLRRLCGTAFSAAQSSRALDEGLGQFVSAAVINNMKSFVTNRAAYVLSILPPDTNAPAALPGSYGGGTITSNAMLAAGSGPYTISTSISVASGATLTIQPGTTLRFNPGVSLTVANGGRLIADGTAALPILFTRNGGSGNWGNITINGAVGSPESRISYARIEFNAASTGTPAIEVQAGTAVLDHLTFANTGAPYIHVDGASFVISHCEFPSTTAAFEPVHGNGAPKAGGRAIFYRNFFGRPTGYNDTVDFTGGNRPGQPIVHFIDNVFVGTDDDILDLDGTDAWVEGNIFLHVHRGASAPDSSSAVSGGNDSGNTSEVTVVNNIFFDCDQAATAKQGNHYTFLNNTVVHQSSAGGLDAGLGAVLNFADDTIPQGRGMFVEGNIMYDVERITRNVTNGTTVANNTYFTNNLMPFPWAGPGGGNSTANPQLAFIPSASTTFTNWATAQVMREWFRPVSNSPAIGTSYAGSDKGIGPIGAKISASFGNTLNDAVFRVEFNRSGNGIPTAGFPNGSGYTAFKWRLDGGPWSAETAIGSSVSVPSFFSGAHHFEVSGKMDSGVYQDDADLGELALTTSFYSKPAQTIRLNEILAANQTAVNHEGTTPDVIELYNPSSTRVDISGLRLTDDNEEPNKFIFPLGTTIPAGGYLVVYANNPDTTSGFHTGFGLSQSGQSVYLYDKVDNGGTLIDSVTFGLQATDFSIGRYGADWVLCSPTFGAANAPATTSNPTNLYINEILTSELTTFPDDFVEIYNPQPNPADMSGLFFSDNPANWPTRSPVPALTFIEAGAYIAFRADGNTDAGADHLAFSLAAERGYVALLNKDYSIIDAMLYGPQTTDISRGRVAGSLSQSNTFTIPTPGAPNPGILITNSGVVINEVLAANATIFEVDGSAPDWIELYNNSTNAVDISGASLTDTISLPRKYVFPANTIIAGRGYLRFTCDGNALPDGTNTGFNIKAESGTLYLFDKLPGGALLNAVQYGLQANDFSISRLPDGTGAFGLSIPTANGPNIPATLASASSVKINEWMPVPSSGEDWFELYNPNPQPVAIGGFYLSDDPTPAGRTKSPIPALSFLGANTNGYQRFWADSDPASGANHANFKLANASEFVVFSSPSNTVIDQIGYTSVPLGVSEGRFPDGAATVVRFPGTESPNEANYLLLTNVVINEALTHTDPPLEDAIELRNLLPTSINIGGWWLSDSKENLRKYRIPDNTIMPGNGFRVFYEYQFNNDPTNNKSAFALSSHGDEIYLSMADGAGNLTGYRAGVKFDAAFNGFSFGRYVTSDTNEEFVEMSARSLGHDDPVDPADFRAGNGLPNPYPRVGPVVIAKILYHPPDIGTNDDVLNEFIELKNVSGSTQPLYDPLYPTNTWRLRDAVDYNFPQGVSLSAGASLLLVSFDPANNPGQLAAFRTKYAVDASMPIYGPYVGKLANDNDKVELWRPDAPDLGEVPYVLVERVHYYDLAPWAAAADGTGAALSRVSLSGYGNDPTNWVAVIPNFGAGTDSDGDGMPNAWEAQYNLNPFDPADANQDLDGDGLTNLQEYLAGTDPTSSDVNNPYASLRIRNVENLGANNARLTFVAISNHTYTVEFKNGLADPAWTRLTDLSAAPTNRTMLINTIVPSTNRFFRLRTPQAP